MRTLIINTKLNNQSKTYLEKDMFSFTCLNSDKNPQLYGESEYLYGRLRC